jgi:SAM-dependent methyltransferase
VNLREYEIMYHVEDGHWWYKALRERLSDAWKRFLPGDRVRLLDVGCGTGANLAVFVQQSQVFGIDYAKEAVHFCRKRGLAATAVASAVSLPFPGSSFDVLVSCDVLCHRSITNKQATLDELVRVVRPGGFIVLNLPAYQWLMSSHDVAVHTDRRFTSPEVAQMFQAAGCSTVHATYWNSLLFPALAAVRLWRRLRPRPSSDLDGASGESMGALLGAVMRLERTVTGYMPLPVGLSIFAVGQKRA